MYVCVRYTHTYSEKSLPNRPAGGRCAACKAKSGGTLLHLIHFNHRAKAWPSLCHMDDDDDHGGLDEEGNGVEGGQYNTGGYYVAFCY